jgi:hypothetical protein
MSILPEGEQLRKAIKWISDEHLLPQSQNYHSLVSFSGIVDCPTRNNVRNW